MPTKTWRLRIPATGADLDADLAVPGRSRGLVLFARAGGGARDGPRSRVVADLLNLHGHCTVLVDLLAPDEKSHDPARAGFRFAHGVLAGRLVDVVDWLTGEEPAAEGLPIGLSGSTTGVALALFAAALRPRTVRAVVSCGGRTDLAGPALTRVFAPTLLLAGDRDRLVVKLNQRAALTMRGYCRIQLISQAGHTFAEPDTLEAVARLTAAWFDRYLTGGDGLSPGRG